MKAVLYARKSPVPEIGSIRGGDVREAEGCEHQMVRCRDYCVRMGWEVIGEFSDAGVSGGVGIREGLNGALGACPRGGVLVVHRLDRFCRSLVHFADLWRRMEVGGIGFVSVTDCFDTTTPIGMAALQMSMVFAEFERRMNSARTSESMRMRMARGERMGGKVPYGWRVGDNRRTMELDEDEQEVIGVIREMWEVRGLSADQIATKLKRTKYIPRGREWAGITVGRIIRRNFKGIERGSKMAMDGAVA